MSETETENRIGIVIVTHGDLGDSLLSAARFITGTPLEGVATVSVDVEGTLQLDQLRDRLAAAIKSVDRQAGVIVLTDMYGGSPANLSYSFLEEGRIEVLSGVNLPVLIRAVDSRREENLERFAADLEAHGKRSISLASGILKGRPQR